MRRPPLRAAVARLAGRHRSVLRTYPGLRMGNVLYFALLADVRQRSGHDFRVLDPDPDNDWAGAFPKLSSFLLPPSQLRFTDRRVDLVESFFQGFGTDFTEPDLTRFIRTVLLDSPALSSAIAEPQHETCGPSVTVNVRRGDYYDDPYFEARFGFDVESYVRAAVCEVESSSGPLGSVLVVSDGPAWCRDRLGWLADHAPDVRFEGPEAGVLGNFRSIARSRRLILTNSTFSYWGAYVSNVVHGDNHREVWVPDLHSRAVADGRPWQHDPRWRVIGVDRRGGHRGPLV